MRSTQTARATYHLEKVALVVLSVVALLLFVLSPKIDFNLVRAQFEQEQIREETVLAPLSPEADLLFASADIVGVAAVNSDAAMTSGSTIDANEALYGDMHNSEEASPDVDSILTDPDGEEVGHGGSSKISGMYPSPVGNLIAVEYDHLSKPQVRLLDLTNRSEPALRDLTPIGWHFFLAWHPDGSSILVSTVNLDITDPGLWIVNVKDGGYTRIDTPGLFASEGIASAAFSPDGQSILYSITNGLGSGSEVWRVDVSSMEQHRVLQDEYMMIGSIVWSPDASRVAFVKLLDSPVAFAEAGLWVMNSEGGDARSIAIMDGGQNQSPVWSVDGERIYYVGRDNPDNLEADYDAELLEGSIRSIGIHDKSPSILVPAEGARQLDLSLTPEGNLLFISSRSGTLEVWSLSDNGTVNQPTNDGAAKRFPVSLLASN